LLVCFAFLGLKERVHHDQPRDDCLNMPKARPPQLARAMRTRSFVRFEGRFDHYPVRGYVLDVGPKLFLLAVVSDHIWFDGFECFRIEDVRNFRQDPQRVFTESALKKRGERLPKKPRVSVASIEELLLSASQEFPLVTIMRERVDPELCWIGRVLNIERGCVSLLEITPDAKWEQKPKSYRLSEITRVSFDADYENALHLVGGDPKQAIKTLTTPRN
jgi:hypothetical protein